MESSEFFQYMNEKMDGYPNQEHWEVKFNPEQYTYEIYMVLQAEVDEDARFKVMDITGRVNNEQEVYLADRVVFYDSQLSYINEEYYLKSFEVDFQQGIEKGLVDCVLKYLQQLANKGRIELDDFLHSTSNHSIEFSLSWQDDNFKQLVKTARESGRYSEDRLSFKEKAHKEKNIIEKFQS